MYWMLELCIELGPGPHMGYKARSHLFWQPFFELIFRRQYLEKTDKLFGEELKQYKCLEWSIAIDFSPWLYE